MAKFILLAFIAVPIIEIAVFLVVGGRIGVLNTIIMIVITAMIGTWLLRSQGLQTLQRAQESLNQNVFPVSEVFDGLCLMVAGGLLLTPGFVTDIFGLLLFVPRVRGTLRQIAWSFLTRSGRAGAWTKAENPMGPGGNGPATIDGKFREIDQDKTDETDKDGKIPPR
ncbi:MAG: FxsA family protein [Proteobacteria bacterium]|nr:FxsA family protein [Pseudomonadota bacterium]MDA1323177.1 FxsA family protein [Pseudomonadota bacterium]